MEGVLAILMVFGIPIIAIWTSYKTKMRKMELEAGVGGKNEAADLKRQLGNLMNENELLRDRVKNLEYIVVDLPSVSSAERKKLKINIEKDERIIEEKFIEEDDRTY